MRKLSISQELLDDDGFDFQGLLKYEFEKADDSTIQLTLMGFNARLGPVPKFLEDKE